MPMVTYAEVFGTKELDSGEFQYRTDEISLDETYFTSEGYLIDSPIVTTCGVFTYKDDSMANGIRRELRLPEEVFAPESLASYKGKPIIVTHGKGRVDTSNVKVESIGTILSDGIPDGDKAVRAQIIIHDIKRLKRTPYRQLSLGYACRLEWNSGIHMGEEYDCIQRNIRINHLAVVREARAGETARLNVDSKDEGGEQMLTDQAKTMIQQWRDRRENRKVEAKARLDAAEAARKDAVDEKDEKDETDAVVEDGCGGKKKDEEDNKDDVTNGDEKDPTQFVRENQDRRDNAVEPTNLDEALAVIAQQDADIEFLLKNVDSMKAKLDFVSTKLDSKDEGKKEEKTLPETKTETRVDSKEIAQIVAERIKVLRVGDRLNLDGLDEMSTLDAKKAVILKINPKMNLDGKSEDYVNAAYEFASENTTGTKLQKSQMYSTKEIKLDSAEDTSDAARSRMTKRMLGQEVK